MDKLGPFLYFLTFCLSVFTQSHARSGHYRNTRNICVRDPPYERTDPTPGDGGFRIQIVGHAERYSPGQVYTIKISGSYRDQTLTGFMLTAVTQHARDESTTLGTFQHIDPSVTRFVPECPYVVTKTDFTSKPEVEVLWTAPGSQVGCIELRATVIERRNVWYKDDGALTKVLCEDTGVTETSQTSETIPDCCACGTAKYEMIFEGRWNSQTHPKDYPTQRRLLHWSNLVGASHSKNYMVWQYGAYASQGVKEVCEFGYPRTTEQEIKQHSTEVRSIIKTTGIWWKHPQGLDQTREARFSTDRRRHLVSMLTMIGPSPDWCIGISAVDMCLPNCTWSAGQTIDLYPWDAGTDDGITYMAPNAKSDPQQKIHKLTNQFPDDPKSPFYGSDPVKPMGVLRIRRISPSDGSDPRECSDKDVSDTEVDFIGEGPASQMDMAKEKMIMMAEGGKCAMTAWEDWSSCSVTCGVGQRFRKRMYLNPMVDESMCGLPTMESENCIGVENECETIDEDCAVTQWSNWSPCSVTCGKGMRERRRYYLKKEDMIRCSRETEEIEICMIEPFDCSTRQNFTAICSLPSLRGPCRGDFERWYYDVYMQKCLPFAYGGCRGNDNRFETMDDCVDMCQRRSQEIERPFLLHPSLTRRDDTDRCLLAADRGPCFRLEENFYFDPVMKKCLPFMYGGCHGNRNRFATEEECAEACHKLDDEFPSINSNHRVIAPPPVFNTPASTTTTRSTTVRPTKPHHRREPSREEARENKKNKSDSVSEGGKCEVTGWSDWSECSATCGNGYKTKRREIKKNSTGKKCGKLEKKTKCKLPSCDSDCTLSDWGPWSDCSVSCGRGIQQRERTVLKNSSNGSCKPRLQRQLCKDVPDC